MHFWLSLKLLHFPPNKAQTKKWLFCLSNSQTGHSTGLTGLSIHICCEVIIWSKFRGSQGLLPGPSRGYYLVQVCFKPVFIVVSSALLEHLVIILCVFFCAQLSVNFLNIAFFSKNWSKNWVFQFCVFFKFHF